MPDNTPCPSKFFRKFRAACEKCTRRQRYDKEKKRCEDCRPDEESEGGFATNCTNCPAGTIGYVSRGSYKGDVVCVRKDFLVLTKDGTCIPCPAGRAAFYPDSDVCENFPTGFPQDQEQSVCRVRLGLRTGQNKGIKYPKGSKPGIGAARCADPATNCRQDEQGSKQFSSPIL